MTAPIVVGAAETPCDREPVHIPGTVQPHGMLLVLPPGGDATAPLLAASETAGPLPAAGSMTGPVTLAALLRPDAVRMLDQALRAPDGAEPLLEGVVSRDGRRWTALLRRGAAATLVELEPEAPADPAAARRILLDLNGAIAAMRRQPDARSACAVACVQLRRISGFDRVMAYRFMPDWSGEVVAESLRPDGTVDSYMGLVFPASDIPAPMRALYARNRLRLIGNAAAAGSPLRALGADASPVDLGDAVLRGVAPVHLQYLANMGVQASMSVAITVSGPEQRAEAPAADVAGSSLWGLLACHNQAGPLFVDHVRRQAAEAIAHALSWRLAELAEAEAMRRAAVMRAAQAPFLDPIGADDGDRAAAPAAPTAAEAAALLAAGEAGGLAVVGAALAQPDALALRVGVLPDEAALRVLAGWLDKVSPGRALVTDRLGSLASFEGGTLLDADHASGLLAMPLAETAAGPGTWVLWFRPELRRLVEWAGHKAEPQDPLQALSPRASFAAWREEMAGRSAAWSDATVAAARVFRDALVAALARAGAQAARSNAALRQRNAEVRFFADAATHDLKEPLWQVQVLCGLIRDGLAELFGPMGPDGLPRPAGHEAVAREVVELELEAMADRVVASAGRMRGMIDELARFAVAGRDPERLHVVPLRRLAEDALEDLGEALRAVPDAAVLIDGLGDLAVSCDPPQLRRVFQNLFSNALKYRSMSRPLVLRVTAEHRAGSDGVLVQVEDNGVGFAPSEALPMFEPFRRFDRDGAAPSEGLGLGLAICARIVDAHGGRIEAVQATPGARFDIVLPVEAGRAGPDVAGGTGDRW